MQPGTAEGYYHTGKPHRVAKPRQRGLTLIELLVAIAVLAIMVTWAIPSYQRFTARNEVATELLRLKTALAITRNTAITRRTTITLCPTADMLQCHIKDNKNGEDWLATLAIFQGKGETGDPLLHSFGKSHAETLTYRNDNNPVRYKATGRSTWHNGTFRICGQYNSGARVVVSNLGRVRVESERPDCKQ